MCDRLAQEGVGRGIRTRDLLVTSLPTPPTWTPLRVMSTCDGVLIINYEIIY